jgi:hypothetical protein
VTLHRERRRRERLQAIAALAPILAASLDVAIHLLAVAGAVTLSGQARGPFS